MTQLDSYSSDFQTAGHIRYRHAVLSNVGRRRSENQDSFGFAQTKQTSLFIIADGMGGAQGGATASALAVNIVSRASFDHDGYITEQTLRNAIEGANAYIFQKSKEDSSLAGMGTTLVALVLGQENILVAHVGDSRAYYFHDNKAEQITRDHTLVQELIYSGVIAPKDASHHPIAHMLTRSIGPTGAVDIEVTKIPTAVTAGDKFFLCCDGLYNFVSDQEISEILSISTPEAAARQFVDLANERGGSDNITVEIIEICEVLDAELARANGTSVADEPTLAHESVSPNELKLPECTVSTNFDEDEELEEVLTFVSHFFPAASAHETTNGLTDSHEVPSQGAPKLPSALDELLFSTHPTGEDILEHEAKFSFQSPQPPPEESPQQSQGTEDNTSIEEQSPEEEEEEEEETAFSEEDLKGLRGVPIVAAVLVVAILTVATAVILNPGGALLRRRNSASENTQIRTPSQLLPTQTPAALHALTAPPNALHQEQETAELVRTLPQGQETSLAGLESQQQISTTVRSPQPSSIEQLLPSTESSESTIIESPENTVKNEGVKASHSTPPEQNVLPPTSIQTEDVREQERKQLLSLSISQAIPSPGIPTAVSEQLRGGTSLKESSPSLPFLERGSPQSSRPHQAISQEIGGHQAQSSPLPSTLEAVDPKNSERVQDIAKAIAAASALSIPPAPEVSLAKNKEHPNQPIIWEHEKLAQEKALASLHKDNSENKTSSQHARMLFTDEEKLDICNQKVGIRDKVADVDAKLRTFDFESKERAATRIRELQNQAQVVELAMKKTTENIATSKRRYDLWKQRKLTLGQGGDPAKLGNEVSLSSVQVKRKKEAYEVASLRYLDAVELWNENPADNTNAAKMAALGRELRARKAELEEAIMVAVDQAVEQASFDVSEFGLVLSDLRRQLDRLNRHIGFASAFRPVDSEQRITLQRNLLDERIEQKKKLDELRQKVSDDEETAIRRSLILKQSGIAQEKGK